MPSQQQFCYVCQKYKLDASCNSNLCFNYESHSLAKAHSDSLYPLNEEDKQTTSARTKFDSLYTNRCSLENMNKISCSHVAAISQSCTRATTINNISEGSDIDHQCVGTRKQESTKHLRSTHVQKSIKAKKHVIRMLFVVVLEFFICWTPLFVVNTLVLYIPKQVYTTLGTFGISFLLLLSYASSCCNPITYCFMHKKFLQGFRHAFGCSLERDSNIFVLNNSFKSQSNNVSKSQYNLQNFVRETPV